jgi:hypothetical protein
MTQTELINAYVLGLSEVINAQWKAYKKGTRQQDSADKDEGSEVNTSDGSGSEHDKAEFNAEMRQIKRQRKNAGKRRRKKNDLSMVVLPSPGDKTVAAEAFQKLTGEQKEQVAAKVNKLTKKVSLQTFTCLSSY